MTTRSTLLGRVVAGLALTAALSAPASAATPRLTPSLLCRTFPSLCTAKPPKTPEIDPGLARGTLTLLIGGVLMIADRRRR